MDRLLRFLFDNPILLFILVAWGAGALGNMLKASKKARDAAGGSVGPRRAPSSPLASQPARRAPAQPGQRSGEDIAAEMRRILGLDPEPPSRPKAEPPDRPKVEPRPLRPVAGAEPPPVPVRTMLGAGERRFEIHVDPHVGESMQHRQFGKGERRSLRDSPTQLGSLGGRVHGDRPKRRTAGRYPLDDLKRIIVLNEILGPPLALRRPEGRDI